MNSPMMAPISAKPTVSFRPAKMSVERGGHNQLPEDDRFLGAKRPHQVDLVEIDAHGALVGGHEGDDHDRKGRHRNLRDQPRAEPDNDDRRQGDDRDRAERHDEGLHDAGDEARIPERQAEHGSEHISHQEAEQRFQPGHIGVPDQASIVPHRAPGSRRPRSASRTEMRFAGPARSMYSQAEGRPREAGSGRGDEAGILQPPHPQCARGGSGSAG